MLSYALAIAVAISSLVLFSTAFLMSKIHRRDDFFWSGVGLFYALVLWYCARNITGAVLLGQAAATALLVSFCWQTIKLRRAIADPGKAAEINNFSILRSFDGLLRRRQAAVQSAAPVAKPTMPKVTEEVAIPDNLTEAPPAKTAIEANETNVPTPSDLESSSAKATEKNVPSPDRPTEQPSAAATDTVATNKTVEPEPPQFEPSRSNVATTKSLVDIEIIDNPAKDTELEAQSQDSQSLPSKLPEVASVAPAEPEPKVAETDDRQDGNLEPKVESESATSSQAPAIATPPEEQLNSEAQSAPTPEPEPKSNLDALETVEVAEVLEAEPDNESDRRGDRSNIIEVTTTEINVVTETVTIDPDADRDPEGSQT